MLSKFPLLFHVILLPLLLTFCTTAAARGSDIGTSLDVPQQQHHPLSIISGSTTLEPSAHHYQNHRIPGRIRRRIHP
ncbi:hypothetical protein C8J55DRAFT_527121 [Lentinula edodes]|uniref:Uncharacterized protein n=1 Tax=Lentinula lateritia TaxID=40482 RepID=A0A9W8ZT74_9AGAR|nr:hypothetical protein C8J55DRAFT_527121 [Lentinula edodes]